jgi:hypothetical protein
MRARYSGLAAVVVACLACLGYYSATSSVASMVHVLIYVPVFFALPMGILLAFPVLTQGLTGLTKPGDPTTSMNADSDAARKFRSRLMKFGVSSSCLHMLLF